MHPAPTTTLPPGHGGLGRGIEHQCAAGQARRHRKHQLRRRPRHDRRDARADTHAGHFGQARSGDRDRIARGHHSINGVCIDAYRRNHLQRARRQDLIAEVAANPEHAGPRAVRHSSGQARRSGVRSDACADAVGEHDRHGAIEIRAVHCQRLTGDDRRRRKRRDRERPRDRYPLSHRARDTGGVDDRQRAGRGIARNFDIESCRRARGNRQRQRIQAHVANLIQRSAGQRDTRRRYKCRRRDGSDDGYGDHGEIGRRQHNVPDRRELDAAGDGTARHRQLQRRVRQHPEVRIDAPEPGCGHGAQCRPAERDDRAGRPCGRREACDRRAGDWS